MVKERLGYRLNSYLWVPMISFYLIGGFLLAALLIFESEEWAGKNNLYRFQHDFFAALAGNEEDMRFPGKEKALLAAKTLRVMGADGATKAWSDLALLAVTYNLKEKKNSQEALRELVRMGRDSEYVLALQGLIQHKQWVETFLDSRMKAAMKNALADPAAAPLIAEPDAEFSWLPITGLLVAVIQFSTFGWYAFSAAVYDPDYFHPLRDMPTNARWRAIPLTFPGNVPIIALIAIIALVQKVLSLARIMRQSGGTEAKRPLRAFAIPPSTTLTTIKNLEARLAQTRANR